MKNMGTEGIKTLFNENMRFKLLIKKVQRSLINLFEGTDPELSIVNSEGDIPADRESSTTSLYVTPIAVKEAVN